MDAKQLQKQTMPGGSLSTNGPISYARTQPLKGGWIPSGFSSTSLEQPLRQPLQESLHASLLLLGRRLVQDLG